MRSLVAWITAAVAVSVVFATIYVVAQNAQRQWADDAPARLASEIAPDPLGYADTHDERVDLASSLGSFWVLYDEKGTAIAGTGYLDGKLARIPTGVVAAASSAGSNHVSWQPAEGLRFATVEVATDDGIVMTGQSLAPSEERTAAMGALVAMGWLVTMLVILAGAVATRLLPQRETTTLRE